MRSTMILIFYLAISVVFNYEDFIFTVNTFLGNKNGAKSLTWYFLRSAVAQSDNFKDGFRLFFFLVIFSSRMKMSETSEKCLNL
jgi:hypothetical protein